MWSNTIGTYCKFSYMSVDHCCCCCFLMIKQCTYVEKINQLPPPRHQDKIFWPLLRVCGVFKTVSCHILHGPSGTYTLYLYIFLEIIRLCLPAESLYNNNMLNTTHRYLRVHSGGDATNDGFAWPLRIIYTEKYVSPIHIPLSRTSARVAVQCSYYIFYFP